MLRLHAYVSDVLLSNKFRQFPVWSWTGQQKETIKFRFYILIYCILSAVVDICLLGLGPIFGRRRFHYSQEICTDYNNLQVMYIYISINFLVNFYYHHLSKKTQNSSHLIQKPALASDCGVWALQWTLPWPACISFTMSLKFKVTHLSCIHKSKCC